MKKMTPKEAMDQGILYYANRDFFRPLLMFMTVTDDDYFIINRCGSIGVNEPIDNPESAGIIQEANRLFFYPLGILLAWETCCGGMLFDYFDGSADDDESGGLWFNFHANAEYLSIARHKKEQVSQMRAEVNDQLLQFRENLVDRTSKFAVQRMAKFGGRTVEPL